MKYVIDSSLGVKWVIPEVDSAKALRLCDDYRFGVIELLAPDFYPARSPIPSPEPNDNLVSPRQRGRRLHYAERQILVAFPLNAWHICQ